MSAADFLQHLDKVKRTGQGTWTACCPAHRDRGPSLAVKETDDGTVLIHCFAGCSTEEVLGAVGMDFDDLFPPKETHHRKPESRPFPAADVLRLMAMESMVVAMTAATMRERTLTPKEIDRVIESAAKINAALTASGIDIKGVLHG